MYKIQLQKHPFNTTTEAINITSDITLAAAYELTEPILPIENVRCTVDGEYVTDLNVVPADNAIVTMKVVPGSDAFSEGSKLTALLGFGLTVVGMVTAPFTGGASVWIIGAGLTMMTGGAIGHGVSEYYMSQQFDSEDSRSDIHGASAGASKWSPVPLIYGTHYNAPAFAASDWTDLAEEDSAGLRETILHQLYVIGDQNNDWGTHPIVDSISIGDDQLFAATKMTLTADITRISASTAFIHFVSSSDYTSFLDYLPATVAGVQISIMGATRPQNNRAFIVTAASTVYMYITTDNYMIAETGTEIELSYLKNSDVFKGVGIKLITDGDFVGSPYPRVVYESYLGKVLEHASDGANAVFYTTPGNTKQATVAIICPRGLYELDGKSKRETGVEVQVKAKLINTDAWQAEPLIIEIEPQSTNKARRANGIINFETSGQWVLEITKVTPDYPLTDETEGENTVNVDRITCVKADDDLAESDIQPVKDAISEKFTFLAMQITADSQLSGSINNLNCIIRHEVHAYDAGLEEWVPAYSNNPAAIFIDVLLNSVRNRYPLVTSVDWDDLTNIPIDWSTMVDWYNYCELEGFSCNGVIASSTIVKEELAKVALTGRATFTVRDGLYTVIIDREQPTPVQLFTPRNTSNFTASRAFFTKPDGVRVKFVNETIGYQSDEAIINYIGSDENTYDELSLDYITSPSQAEAYGRYYLNVKNVRQETFTFTTDFEYLVCSAGSRIKFQHDIPLLGIVSARVTAIAVVGGEIAAITIDENIEMAAGSTYVIELRVENDGEFEILTIPVSTGGTSELLVLEPDSPIIEGTIIVGDLLAFGESGTVIEDLIISDIATSDNLGATITAIKYDEAIYDLTAFTTYASNVSARASEPLNAYVPTVIDNSIVDLNVAIEDGADSGTLEYGKNTSLTAPPGPDTYFTFDGGAMLFSEEYIGLVNWWRTPPLPVTVLADEYVWQRREL